ncbi:hypothetical protein [Hyalangium versicolor]|uniref:hypothetical protein n=1 Tax=Hyalangium versicolor TaxID=2861190 RepID=UPI001CCD7095|nr:hypothetical protein [Hyalangium versicolor]
MSDRRERSAVRWMEGALLVVLGLAGCTSSCSRPVALAEVPRELQGTAPETAVTLLPLGGPLQSDAAELSGLAWYGDHLIMLPQYPDWQGGGVSCLYTVSKADILARLDHTASGALEPRCIPFDGAGHEKRIQGFEGYEAIEFAGDQAYLTVETVSGSTGTGIIVTGRIAPDLSGLKLEASPMASIPLPVDVSNAGFETLVVGEDRVLALYEANGALVNPGAAAESFDRALTPSRKLPLPPIEYRITDATSMDEEGRFWVINYNYPGSQKHFKPAPDPFMARYGTGPTHARKPEVERLIELQVKADGIVLTGRPPLQLQLIEGTGRNWEGLVRLDDRGFLMVTDKFPKTLLGFVPGP